MWRVRLEPCESVSTESLFCCIIIGETYLFIKFLIGLWCCKWMISVCGVKELLEKCIPNNKVVMGLAHLGIFAGRHILFGNRFSEDDDNKSVLSLCVCTCMCLCSWLPVWWFVRCWWFRGIWCFFLVLLDHLNPNSVRLGKILTNRLI